jgi:hypothetical protein
VAAEAVMSTIVVNLFAVLFWAISAVLWWVSSGPPGAALETLASELQVAAYYSKWAAIAACIAAALQMINALMGAWRARRR